MKKLTLFDKIMMIVLLFAFLAAGSMMTYLGFRDGNSKLGITMLLCTLVGIVFAGYCANQYFKHPETVGRDETRINPFFRCESKAKIFAIYAGIAVVFGALLCFVNWIIGVEFEGWIIITNFVAGFVFTLFEAGSNYLSYRRQKNQ